MTMKDTTLTIRITEEEKGLIAKYADIFGMSMAQFVRRVVLERIEDEEDMAAFDDAMKEFRANPGKGLTVEEMKAFLD